MLKKIFNKNLLNTKNTSIYTSYICDNKFLYKLQYQNFAYNKSFRSRNSNPVQFKYKIEEFNPKSSKYSLKNAEKIVEQPNQEQESPGVKIPKYLEIEEFNRISNEESGDAPPRRGISLKGLKSGKRLTVIKPAFQKKMTLKERAENKKQLLLESEQKGKELKKLPLEERMLLENNETSLVRHQDKYIEAENIKYKQELMKIRKDKIAESKRVFNTENLVHFKQEERLSKRLARLGVTSRRQAEKMIEKGMIKIDGKTVTQNVPVTDQTNIQVYSSNGYKTPINESTRVWLFYKPEGIVCTKNDEKGRISIHKFLEAKKFPVKHFVVAGKLDINSEGLVVLTNNGDLAAALENNITIERCYKVRVYGRMFTEEKLNKIRTGVRVNMRTVKLWAEFINKQSCNTWVHIKAYNNSIVDIRNVFRKLSLRVNRIIRINYGPFTMGVLRNPGEVTETNIPKVLHKYMYDRMQEKTQTMIRKLDDTKLEEIKLRMLKEQKLGLTSTNKQTKQKENLKVDNKQKFNASTKSLI